MPRKRYDPRGVGYMSTGEYERGYDDGYQDGQSYDQRMQSGRRPTRKRQSQARAKPRKLSAWQKYIKNKKNHIKMRNGKLNLKKMAVQYRKKRK